MGILKSLLLDIAQKVLSTAAESPVETKKASVTPASQPVQRDLIDSIMYFRDILAAEFPQYGVKENVPVTDLTGPANDSFKLYEDRPLQAYKAEWGEPYTFVLYLGDVPKGIVMLGDGHSHNAKVKFLISRMYAQKLGLPYINFYTQMPNEKDYVISRIERFMNG